MKGFKLISLIISTMVNFQVWAQTDLSIVSTQNFYQFESDGQENIVTFEFTNLGPNIASSGVTVTFTKDMFVDPTFDFSSVNSNDFGCSPNGETMDCNLIPTSFDPLTSAFIDLGLIIQPGDVDLNPAFSVLITDQSGADSNLLNNSLFVDVEYSSGGMPDFQVTLLDPTQPIQYPVGSNSQAMVFDITNIGSVAEGDQTTVTFDINPDLDPMLSNPASADSADPNWTCGILSTQVVCDYFASFGPATSSQINLNIPIPDTLPIPATISNAIGVSVFNALGDPDPSNNTFQYDIEIINGGPPSADLDISIDTNPAGQASFDVADVITFDVILHNPFASNVASPNASVATTLPMETVFSSAQSTNVSGWLCVHDGSATGGVVTCDNQGIPVLIGTTVDIQITALANSPTVTLVSATAVSTSDFDGNSSNNADSAFFEIFPATANLSMVFTTSSGIYNQGDSIAYSVEIENPFIIPRNKKSELKADPADTSVIFTLPNEVTFDDADTSGAAGWSCIHDNAASGGLVTCDRSGSPFLAGSVHNITVNVIAALPAINTLVQVVINSAADPDTSNNTVNQSDVINAVFSDFSITKVASNNDFAIGDAFTYVLTINNPASSTASPIDVFISDQLPPEVSYASFIVASNLGTTVNCIHDGSTTGGLFSCDTNGMPFLPGETVTIDVNVTAAIASTNVDNTATIETVTDPDGASNNNTDNASTVVINDPLMTIITATKSASIAGVPITTINYGQSFEYLLEVQNTGLNDAQNVVVTDILPAEVSWINTQSPGWSCTGGTDTRGTGADIDCTLDVPLTPGTTAQIVVNVIATTNTSITSINNTMYVNSDNIGPEVNAVFVLVVQNSQASLTLSQMPSPVDPDADVDFALLVDNTGTIDLTGIQIDSQLPTGFTYNGFSGDAAWNCTENTGAVSCAYTGTLASNASSTLNFETTATTPLANQNYALDATLSANELSADVIQSLTVGFSTGDVSTIITSVPQQAALGETFKHVIRIKNSGNIDLDDVSAIYVVPETVIFLGIVSSEFNCTSISRTISCDNLQPLTTGSITAKLEINLRVDDFVGLIPGRVSVNADGIRRIANTSTQIISNVQNDLSLTKSASVSEVSQKGSYAYRFDVVNMGSETQTNFSLNDQLPAGVVYQGASGHNWACDGNDPLSCQFSGSLSAGGQTQLSIDVIAPNETGVVNNTASIKLTGDENASNDTSSAAVNVVVGQGGGTARADLSVSVEANNSGVLNTEQVSWRIEVTNNGPDTAENVTVSNFLPMGFVAENAQVNNGAECTLLVSSLMCEIATLAVNQNNEIILKGSFSNGFSGLVINTVEVQSDAIDENPSNNTGNDEVTVTEVDDLNADLALESNATNQQVQQGGVVDLSITAKNLGPDRAVQAKISGSLSGLIENVQLLSTGGWMCQTNNNALACEYPGDFQLGMQSEISLRIQTQQVVQQSQPVIFNAMIESASMDSQPGNNMVGFSNEVTRTPTEDEIFAIFQNAVGSAASETVIQSIRNVSSYCARSYFMAIEGLCEEFIDDATPENGGAIINAMEEITPNEVAAQANSASEIITSQFRNVGSRLAQLRGGGGSGFSVAGLNGRYGNESIPLGMLSYLNQSEDEQAVSNINDFVSPWGFFVNGSISMGERDATGQELGFDFDTFGLTAGVDYRFNSTQVAGIALGYANFDSEIEGEAEMKSSGLTLTGYGSFYLKDNFYVDARISYGNPDFEQKRRINFAVDEIVIDRVATGSTDSDQYSVAMSAGYHFNKNSWNITPNASIRYVKTTIDAFQESGAGGFNFAFGEQEVKSMVWSIGTSVSKAISLKKGIVSPQFDINFSRETENDGGLLEARFINAPDDEIFWIGTDEPDRTYGSAGVGLVFIGANGKQAYINYRSIFGLEGFTRGTINVGARFEF